MKNPESHDTRHLVQSRSSYQTSDGRLTGQGSEVHQDLLATRAERKATFLKLSLNSGISGFNVIVFFLYQFSNMIALMIAIGYMSFILRDPKYYNLAQDKVVPEMSQMSVYAEFIMILEDLLLGPLIDLTGRKVPIILGQFMTGASLIIIPMFH